MSEYLDLNTTYQAILASARERQFISYADLAKANDTPWKKVRYQMNQHLGDLIQIAAGRGWPLPSAIVVNQKNIEAGILDGTARNGFVNAAQELGFNVPDPAAFVQEQQDALFAWAKTAPDQLVLSPEELAQTRQHHTRGNAQPKCDPRVRTHSQKITVAARAIAERKTVGLLS